MNSSETEMGYRVYWEGTLTTGSVIYFDEERDYILAGFVQVFESEEEARKHCSAIRSHGPHMFIHSQDVFQILENGKNLYVLGFNNTGSSLAVILRTEGKEKFYSGIWITTFYRNLLMNLLLVIRYSMDTEVEVHLDPLNIFVGDHCFNLIGWSLRNPGAAGTIAEYTKLYKIIEHINEVHGPIDDLEWLTNILKSPTQSSLSRICRMPLFWDDGHRIWFPHDVWDAIERGGDALCSLVNGQSPFGEKELHDVYEDIYLRQWYIHLLYTGRVDKWREIHEKEQGRFSRHPNEIEARMCMYFIQKCQSSFIGEKYRNPSLPFTTVEELMKRFEVVFPKYIWHLCEVASKFEEYMGMALVPVQNRLRHL